MSDSATANDLVEVLKRLLKSKGSLGDREGRKLLQCTEAENNR